MFLRDEELIALINAKEIVGVRLDGNPDGPRSPAQPCSLDLTIGNIFVPGAKSGELGGSMTPRLSHTLGVGETVVVETKEVFHLPSDVGAFGFPPTTISKVGVLVTNLGHIDPGYDGTIKFTLVNMGKKSYSLRAGDFIYTTLFFRMAKAVRADYRTRNPPAPVPTPTPATPGVAAVPIPASQMEELLDSLPSDFLDVAKRAKDAAKEAVTGELRNPIRTAVVVGVGTLLALAGNIWLTFDRASDVRSDFDKHKAAIEQRLSIEATASSAKASVDQNRLEIEQLKSEVKKLTAELDKRRK